MLRMALWLVAIVSLVSHTHAAPRPNILLILADDLGYGDLHCFGNSALHTPHLDRLASEGLKLTDCYSAAANCSPARAGLMTGRTPWRAGIYNWIPMLSPMHLRAEEITIASLLQDSGYQTAHIGKWHLNGMFNLPGQPQPSDHGFDHWFSTQNNALPNHRHPWNFVRNGIPVGPQQAYAAEIVAEEASRWLKQDWKRNQPFFAFVCFHEPHEPIASAPKYMAHYQHLEKESHRAHHGNITQLDVGVGRLMDTLRQLKVEDSTLVIFTSDNGPALTRYHPHGSAGPLRAHKGYVYDGGIRVPGIIRWPGQVAPNSESDEPVIGTDVLPTLCEVAGAPLPNRELDGTSWMPLFRQQLLQRRQPLYWHFYRARSAVKVAIRDGRWKLAARLDGPEFKPSADITAADMRAYKTAELTGFELYDLASDVAEQKNLVEAQPQRFAQMRDQLTRLYREVRDESPTWPEWQWPRYESKRIEWPDY